jgi:hypothetical protein
MNSWTISFREVSAGHFTGKAQRDTGNVIEMDGMEDLLPRLLQSAFIMETQLGTIPGLAAFIISKAANPKWTWQYHENVLGSWSGSSACEDLLIDYDGKDFVLVASSDNRSRGIWSDRIEDLKSPDTKYFGIIASQT